MDLDGDGKLSLEEFVYGSDPNPRPSATGQPATAGQGLWNNHPNRLAPRTKPAQPANVVQPVWTTQPSKPAQPAKAVLQAKTKPKAKSDKQSH